jgi:hypothetical protein
MINLIISLIFSFLSSFYHLSTSTSLSERQIIANESNIDIQKILESLSLKYNNADLGFKVVKVGDTYYLYVGCTFDVYSISDGDQIENLYQLDNRGYTCGNYFFPQGDKFYSIFGYGLWNSHSDLLEFDSEIGSWEFLYTENQPLNYSSSLVFRNDFGLVALFGNSYNPRLKLNSLEEGGYFLNWNTKSWNKLAIITEGAFENYEFHSKILHNGIESLDYFLFVNNDDLNLKGWFIIDKSTLEIRFIQKGNIDFLHSPFLEVTDNTISFKRPNGSFLKLDLKGQYQLSTTIGRIEILPTKGEKKNTEGFMYLLVILALLLVAGFAINPLNKFSKTYQINKKRKNGNEDKVQKDNYFIDLSNNLSINDDESNNSLEEIQELFKILNSLNDEVLSSDKLEEVLGIDQIKSFDNKRSKRAKLIREINQISVAKTGRPLLSRIRDTNDKRYIFYKINSLY